MNSTVSARLNADLLDEKYAQWRNDPRSVDPTWAAFFDGFELGSAQTNKEREESGSGTASGSADSEQNLNYRGKCVSLVYNYRTLGHTQAYINPLATAAEKNPRLALDQFGLTPADLTREASTQFFQGGKKTTLKELIDALELIYSNKTGFEFMHIHNTEVRNWIRAKIENRFDNYIQTKEEKAKNLKYVLEAELFESFLGKRFLGEKRFSLEGGEGAMVLLNTILEQCPSSEVKEIELGMAHRGRLNILRNFLRKTLTTILYEFTPDYVPDIVAGDGDVKYHLGYEIVRELPDGNVRLSLAANPSHLEAVNAITEGKARARQRILGDDGHKTNRKRVLPILIHGDAAFAGQGSVAEVLNLSQLPGYQTGGTIHIVINNQIGFTTMPEDARSSAYATDIAKMIEAPILHVNGESIEDLVWSAKFALEYRQKFGKDVVLDMYCYRRQGHNETDQAAFTAPHIYRNIDSRDTFGKSLKAALVADGSLSQAEVDKLHDDIWNELEEGYQKMLKMQEQGDRSVFSGSTAEAQPPYSHAPVNTGLTEEVFNHIGKVLTTIPEGFNLHPTLAKRFIPARLEALESGQGFNWGFAEALAWGGLLLEGNPVRLSGQDVRRGTFSHRHAVFYDGETRDRHIPLQNLAEDQAKFCVYNSLLSEFAVLGFDYGYSLGCPEMLCMWEAQFGDFSNGAQVIIDQFISSAESKWQTPSSLVMLLPHGYEGMGPEHSSARLERFLQLCAENNMQVGNFTTPAQIFHALRRQKKRAFSKPYIIMTPKSLLSRAEAVSPKEDFLDGTCFQEILPDIKQFDDPGRVERIVFCSGKVFYDLNQHRNENEITNTAILRVEQLYPFHNVMVQALVSQFPNVTKFVWCQEEPQNMGAWTFIAPHLMSTLNSHIRYAGRQAASSPATGAKATHKKAQAKLIEDAFNV